MFFQKMGELQNHVGLHRHLFFLVWVQKFAVHHLAFAPVFLFFKKKGGRPVFSHQHPPPRKPVALFRPKDTAGVEEVTPGEEDLESKEEN